MDGIEVTSGVAVVPRIAPAQQLGEAENGVHRGADLVAHVGQEVALCLVGPHRRRSWPFEPDAVLLDLGDVVHADQYAARFAVAAEHRRTVDLEGAQARLGVEHVQV